MQLALLLGSLGPRGARALCMLCERTREAAGTPAAFFEEAEPSVSFFLKQRFRILSYCLTGPKLYQSKIGPCLITNTAGLYLTSFQINARAS